MHTGRMRQPLHPIVAHFPVAFLLAATVCDLLGEWPIAHAALAAGLVTGLLALLLGIVEVFLRPISSEAYYWLVAHAAPMQVALVLYLVSFAMRGDHVPSAIAIGSSLGGAALLIGGTLCGGVLVYRFRIGTRPRPPVQRSTTDDTR
jgi:uncharacterized membrane protein